MAQQIINIGTIPNDKTGDDIRAGATKINENFTEVYGFKKIVTVGTGGDYATHQLAYAAGERIVRQISNVTETASPAINANYVIDGQGFTLTCNYQFSKNNAIRVELNRLTVTSTYVGSYLNGLFQCAKLVLNECDFTFPTIGYVSSWVSGGISIIANNTNFTINTAIYLDVANCYFLNCKFTGVNTCQRVMTGGSGTYTRKFDNCEFAGSYYVSAPNSNVFYTMSNTIVSNCYCTASTGVGFNNVRLFENCNRNQPATVYPFRIAGTNITSPIIENCNNIYFEAQGSYSGNLEITNSVAVTIREVNATTIPKLIAYNSNITLDYINSTLVFTNGIETTKGSLTGDGLSNANFTKNKIIANGTTISAAITLPENNSKLTDCSLSSTLTIDGSYINVVGCNVVGAFTNSATADKNMLAYNRSTAAIVDNGTNTIGIATNTTI